MAEAMRQTVAGMLKGIERYRIIIFLYALCLKYASF